MVEESQIWEATPLPVGIAAADQFFQPARNSTQLQIEAGQSRFQCG
jgi:hypothetical protein